MINIPVGEVLKNPAIGNGTSAGVVLLLALSFLNPEYLPFAHAEHIHDIKNVQTVVDSSLEKAQLRTEIKIAAREIDDFTTQIELELCIKTGCAFEKAQKKRAENRRDELNKQLNRL